MIASPILETAADIRQRFQTATPFKHVVLDDFLERDKCDALLKDFPAFDEKNATDERGRTGRKAVVEKVSRISPFYGEFYRYINSAPFLLAMSAVTGIPDLIADATLFGGGTHDNQDGQSLDTHIDFNIDERNMLHRRVNVLLYLNREWDEDWGGAIELHSDPRNPAANSVRSFAPMFNRALIFETSERSWHGFQRITLPLTHRHLSRKSFSIYLYTKDRPAEESVAPHTTFYVPQPLPERFQAGYRLTEMDALVLHRLMASRDGLLELYQRLLIEKEQRLRNGEVARAATVESHARGLLMRLLALKARTRQALGI